MDKRNLAFDRTNFILLGIGFTIVVIGFILMSGPGSTEQAYNPDIFSFRRIKLAPVVTFFSFVRIIVLPLPGFTCWKSMQSHIPLSIRMQVPILISCELIIFVYLFLILTFYYSKYTLL